MIEALKQRILAKSAQVRRYEQRIEQFGQNRIFDIDQKKIKAEFNEGGARLNGVPNAEESKRFWSNIWNVGRGHNGEAEWLEDIKNELRNDKHLQERVVKCIEKITKQFKKMPYWNTPGKDSVQCYWIKNLSNLHERIAIQINKILMGNHSLPAWVTLDHSVLC